MDARSPQSTSSSIFSSSPTTDKATKAIASSTPTDDYPSDDDDSAQKKLTDRIKQLRIDPVQHRFFGKSSGVTLIQTAMDLKKEITGNDRNPKAPPPSSRRQEFGDVLPVCLLVLFISQSVDKFLGSGSAQTCHSQPTLIQTEISSRPSSICISTKSMSSSLCSTDPHSKGQLRTICTCMTRLSERPSSWRVLSALNTPMTHAFCLEARIRRIPVAGSGLNKYKSSESRC